MKRFLTAFAWVGLTVGCGGSDDDDDDDDDVYASCESVDECVDEVPEDARGACLDKGSDGFCTWLCDADEECSDVDQALVCASFESDEAQYCFPSCEDGDDSCPPRMGCRSTGGGSANRKVCFPEAL